MTAFPIHIYYITRVLSKYWHNIKNMTFWFISLITGTLSLHYIYWVAVFFIQVAILIIKMLIWFYTVIITNLKVPLLSVTYTIQLSSSSTIIWLHPVDYWLWNNFQIILFHSLADSRSAVQTFGRCKSNREICHSITCNGQQSSRVFVVIR